MSGINNTEEPFPFFFYGTLRRGQQNYMLLRGHTESEEPAFAYQMELYSLGAFPMMVQGIEAVRGELVRLQPAVYHQLLGVFDHLEGYRPEVPEECLYHRELISVIPEANAQPVWAWAYIGNINQIRSRCIHVPQGDWVQYRVNLMKKTRFGRFMPSQHSPESRD